MSWEKTLIVMQPVLMLMLRKLFGGKGKNERT